MNGRGEAAFTEGDLSRHVMRLSGFMILGFLAMTLGQFVEAVYLGLVSTEAIAAITFTFPAVMALGAAVRGLTLGGAVTVARAMELATGSGRRCSRPTDCCCCLASSSFAEPWSGGLARPLFHLMGARGEVLDLVRRLHVDLVVGVSPVRAVHGGHPVHALQRRPGVPRLRHRQRIGAADAGRAVPDLRLGRCAGPWRGGRGLVVRHRTVAVLPVDGLLVLRAGTHDPPLVGRLSCVHAHHPARGASSHGHEPDRAVGDRGRHAAPGRVRNGGRGGIRRRRAHRGGRVHGGDRHRLEYRAAGRPELGGAPLRPCEPGAGPLLPLLPCLERHCRRRHVGRRAVVRVPHQRTSPRSWRPPRPTCTSSR